MVKQRLITWLLRYLTCSVDPEMVVTYDERTNLVFVNGEQISHSEALSLKQEAKMLQSTRIWSLMQETLKHHARETMVTKSKTFEDMRSGKLMLYNLNIQQKIIAAVERYTIKKS